MAGSIVRSAAHEHRRAWLRLLLTLALARNVLYVRER